MVNKLLLRTEEKFPFVSPEEKSYGDGNYSYFPEQKQQNSQLEAKNREFQKGMKMISDFSKILSTKLLNFADVSPKELKDQFKNNISEFLQKLDDSLKVIKLEATVLQNMGNYLTDFKQEESQNRDKLFD